VRQGKNFILLIESTAPETKIFPRTGEKNKNKIRQFILNLYGGVDQVLREVVGGCPITAGIGTDQEMSERKKS